MLADARWLEELVAEWWQTRDRMGRERYRRSYAPGNSGSGTLCRG
jgi:hypothetical protein